MNNSSTDDRAVSPVIGVILMVAITVILAAVIGTFVLNLGGSVQQNVQAGASVECNAGSSSGSPGTVDVTWTSNQNAESLDVSFDPGTPTNIRFSNNSAATTFDTHSYSGAQISNVGGSKTVTEEGTYTDNDVGVTVTGVKGEQSTVITTKDCTI